MVSQPMRQSVALLKYTVVIRADYPALAEPIPEVTLANDVPPDMSSVWRTFHGEHERLLAIYTWSPGGVG